MKKLRKYLVLLLLTLCWPVNLYAVSTNINGLVDLNAPPVANDYLVIWDTSTGLTKKVAIEKVLPTDLVYVSSYNNDIAATLTAIGTTETTIVVSESITLTEHVAFPATLFVKISPGATIARGAYNLTLTPGKFEGSPGCFDQASTGRVLGLREWKPEWFDADVIDGTTDSQAAFNAMSLCITANTGVNIQKVILDKKYYLATGVTFNTENLVVDAYNGHLWTDADITLFKLNSAGTVKRNIRWFGGLFTHSDGTTGATNNTAIAIDLQDCRDAVVQNVKFGNTSGVGLNTCIKAGVLNDVRILDNYAYACGYFFDLALPYSGVPQIISIERNQIASNFEVAINLDVRFSDVWIRQNDHASQYAGLLYAVTGSSVASGESQGLHFVNNTGEQLLAPLKYIEIDYDTANYLDTAKIKDNHFVSTATYCDSEYVDNFEFTGNDCDNIAAIALTATNLKGTIKITGNEFGQTTAGGGTMASVGVTASTDYNVVWGGNSWDFSAPGTLSLPFEKLRNLDTPVFFGPYRGDGAGSPLLVTDIDSDTYQTEDLSTGSADITTITDIGRNAMFNETHTETLRAVYVKLKARDSGSAAGNARVELMPKMPGSVSGAQDGGNNQALLTDADIGLTIDAVIGWTVYNVTDGSSGPITDNTATTVTATLTGGTDNDWDDGDVALISGSPALTLNLNGVPNDAYREIEGWVPVDADGKITMNYVATGATTLDVSLFYLGIR